MSASTIHIRLLGGFEATVNGQAVDATSWSRRSAASLVKLLALTPGHRLHREQVIDALWPDDMVDDATPKLHKAAHFARRALVGPASIVLRGDSVALLPDATVTVDALEFERCVTLALRNDDASLLARAVAEHGGGDLLPTDLYDSWTDEPRRQLRRLYADALRRLDRWDDVLAIEPTDERAHLARMRAFVAAGDHAAAIRQYDALESVLRNELAASPSPEAALLRRTLVAPLVETARRSLVEFDTTQQIRFCYTADKTRLAYAEIGAGPPLVKAANWLSHLDYDWDSIVWRHWLRALAGTHRLVRYDERGCGLSDWNSQSFSLEHWVEDLETVVDAAGLDKFPLLGVSQGAAVAVKFAARHPERVSCLVLYGGFVFGPVKRGRTDEERRRAELLPQLAELGWGTDEPSFRQVFTARFMPDGTTEQWRAFNELQRRTTSPENAAKFLNAVAHIDVTEDAQRVSVPALILHARGDQLPPIDQGRQLAALIPNSKFVPLDSNNHLLLEHEPAWTRFLLEVERFLDEHGQ
ncbi:MAG TPA: alpha/beta fold hydrolase [Acidimicrobiales bacterium]|nr:alpha/beta fold hydrolase [Acidimicrobiales bacterium]